MFKKSRIKIVAVILLVQIILLGGTLGIIYLTSYAEVYRQNQDMLERYVREYSVNGSPQGEAAEEIKAEDAPAGTPAEPPGEAPADPPERDRQQAGNNRFWVSTFYSAAFSMDGQVLTTDNGGNSLFTEEKLAEAAGKLLEGGKRTGTAGNFVYRIDDNKDYTLVVFMDNTLITDSITTLFRYTLIFGGLMLVPLIAVSVYLSGKIIRPLEESYEKQKQFISDAGHELKTPISVISANGEMLSRQIGSNKWLMNILSESSRMSALVTQLLNLARTEHVALEQTRLDMGRLVTGGTLPFECVAYERGITLECQAEEEIWVNGNKDQLGQLVSILVDNALTHSPDDGKVCVRLSRERHQAVLSVSNEGDEIPPKEREKIFERFYREDDARSRDGNHYGLGLAIARAAVTAHRGKIGVSCKDHIIVFTARIPCAGR